jgi:signal transduction histidine kinase
VTFFVIGPSWLDASRQLVHHLCVGTLDNSTQSIGRRRNAPSNAETILAIGEVSDESKFLLTTIQPTPGQRRLALAVAAVLLFAFCVTVPFTRMHLPPLDAFIPTLLGIFFVNDLITAVLLFSQFSIGRSRALLILASGYLFAALTVIPFSLTFPGAFSPTGLLGAGLQSAAWLYAFWHFGFAAAMLAYAWLKDADPTTNIPSGSTRSAIRWSLAVTLGLVCGLAWLATAQEGRLGRVFYDTSHMTHFVFYIAGSCVVVCALALALLWVRRRSLLDQWLMVVALAMISEMVLGAASNARFDLGFFAGRIYTLVTSVVVLVVLIAETTKTEARLARSNMMLQREQNNKMMNLAAMAASITHEVRQPLGAIAMNARAALQFLGHAPPKLAEARSILDAIVSNSRRASQIFDNIASLFKGDNREQKPVDMNQIVLGALHILRQDLKEHGVTTRTELTAGLSHVIGHRGQLQEVMLNLVRNAIEAMDSTEEGARVLQVGTARYGLDDVAVTVEDSGPGYDPRRGGDLFDPFVTSKAEGMGLGLAICRMIIERHGGQLSARSNQKSGGALFQFTLPIQSAARRTAP